MSAPAPFSCSYSPNFAELLIQLRCALILSTFQAGKVIFISPKNKEDLVQLPRTFNKAMGVALDGDKMAVATKEEVIFLRRSEALAASYPKKPQTYDTLFVPRATYYTGGVDIHDLHFGKSGLWAVNTSFSCLCTIDQNFSFTPRWKPNFISQLASEDRCHLNGLAMEEGKPKYVSALGTGDSTQAWRENITSGGVIMDVESGEIVASGLAMPHTPRLYDGKLYCLLSAAEKLVCIDPNTGKYEDVAKVEGFVRGMAKQGDFVFIATSRLRKNSSTFKHLKIAEKADVAGITVVHLPTGSVTARLIYKASVDEIFDVQVLPDFARPNIVNTYGETHHRALMIPGGTFWGQERKL